jgi:tetratricopeptide (TPR) repeat protein
MQARYSDAIELYEQALPTYREIGDRLGEANALTGYGVALAAAGSPSAAAVLDDAARIFELLGLAEAAQAVRELARHPETAPSEPRQGTTSSPEG